MPRISSANPDFTAVNVPADKPNYSHGMGTRQSFIPLAFQVTSPFSSRIVLMPHALVMHVNPQNYSEQHTKKVERIQTRGGFVEQHWGDELTEITADGSTGAFMNIFTGLTSLLRQQTIAWDRYRDLHDLYRNNGSLYNPFGAIVLQGNIMLMYDRGTYIGYFNHWDVEETDDLPFSFKASWTFKVQEELMKIPNLTTDPSQRGTAASPTFQGQNAYQSANTIPGSTATPQSTLDAAAQSNFNQLVSGVTAASISASPDLQQVAAQGVSQAQAAFDQGNAAQANQILAATQKKIASGMSS